MRHSIQLQDKTLSYMLKKSARARVIRLAIYPDGAMTVTLPNFLGLGAAEKFLREKTEWILQKLALSKEFKETRLIATGTRKDFIRLKGQARKLINLKLRHFNQVYNFRYGRVAIRDQKTCWGSCSAKANLNFNYRLVLLPEILADYVIVHELCHLAELNHSKRFWHLVGQTLPHYRILRRQLRLV